MLSSLLKAQSDTSFSHHFTGQFFHSMPICKSFDAEEVASSRLQIGTIDGKNSPGIGYLIIIPLNDVFSLEITRMLGNALLVTRNERFLINAKL
ncbi:MAG: hypothetical protein JW801_02185 [Bacteroidales bacterium]|nr:hypothetical protein [Bacteroidales bacterium]